MKRFPLAVSLLLVVVGGLAGPVAAVRDDQNFAGASGAELVRALVPTATRVADVLEGWLARSGETGTARYVFAALAEAAWSTCQRGLRPEVARLATASPEEVESQRAHRYGGDPTPLDGERFHLARQVAALWGENLDPLTRAKALIAFALHYDVANDRARRGRFSVGLWRAARHLTPEAREAAGAFLDWGEAKRRADETRAADAPVGEPRQSALRKLARPILELPAR